MRRHPEARCPRQQRGEIAGQAVGKLTSWGWNAHVLGGEYRVLQTMTAKDNASLLNARDEIIEAIYGDGDNAAANEYSTICTSHADYLWEVQHESN